MAPTFRLVPRRRTFLYEELTPEWWVLWLVHSLRWETGTFIVDLGACAMPDECPQSCFLCSTWYTWAPRSYGDTFSEISNISSPDGNSKRTRMTPRSSQIKNVCWYLPPPETPGQSAQLTARMIHWLVLYPPPSSPGQEQLQVPLLPELFVLLWANMVSGCS